MRPKTVPERKGSFRNPLLPAMTEQTIMLVSTMFLLKNIGKVFDSFRQTEQGRGQWKRKPGCYGSWSFWALQRSNFPESFLSTGRSPLFSACPLSTALRWSSGLSCAFSCMWATASNGAMRIRKRKKKRLKKPDRKKGLEVFFLPGREIDGKNASKVCLQRKTNGTVSRCRAVFPHITISYACRLSL